MPTFGYIGKYKVKLYARDHNPPHVHMEHGSIVVRIDIHELAIMSIEGRPSRRELRCMLLYIERYKEDLLEVWNEFQKED